METTKTTSNTSPYGSSAMGDGDTINKATTGAHAAVDKAASAADDATRKVKPAIERVAAYAHQAVDKAADVASPAADWIGDKGKDLKATQQKLMDDTCAYVKANPLKSVGIALVAGFLLSRII
jgi:ElaB/YqjD/DUF883 family membrane-anchored ribosome-binding protein